MIKLTKQELESGGELHPLFKKCTVTTHVRNLSKLCMKVFHARVNKYMVATEEIELEKKGKAVKV